MKEIKLGNSVRISKISDSLEKQIDSYFNSEEWTFYHDLFLSELRFIQHDLKDRVIKFYENTTTN